MATHRASTISLKQVGGAADKAIKLAAEKHKVRFEKPTFEYVPDWQTLGGILMELADLRQAQGVAQDITNSINQAVGGAQAAAGGAGGHFQPVVIWAGGNHVICGARPAPQIVLNE
jgi:hypothetical protein